MANTVRILAILDDKVSSGLDKINDRFKTLGKSKGAASILQGVGLGAGAKAFDLIGSAAGAAADFIGDSIDAARDMNETLSKSRTVFGAASRSVESFASTTARSLGISKQAAVDAAAGFGFLFTGLGESQKEAAAMSRRMVTLAADMASFNNIDPNEALDKLKSGLSGEAEPLRQVAIFLNEGKVKAKAYQLGIAKVGDELTEGQKVQARYNVILEDAGVQMGDAARTIGQLAGQQRVLSTVLADSQAELGEKFTGGALAVTQFQVAVIDALGWVGDFLDDNIDHWTFWDGAVRRSTEKAIEAQRLERIAVDEGRHAYDRAAKGIGKSVDEIIAENKELLDSATATAAGLISDAFDPLIERYQLVGDLAEIAAGKREVAAGKASAAEKLALLEAKRSAAQHLVALAEAGLGTDAVFAKGIADLKDSIKRAKGPAKAALQELLNKILEIRRLGPTKVPFFIEIGGKKFVSDPKGQASGGPVSANTPYIVGEKGPELFVPNASGTIIPNGASAGGGGGGTTVNFNSIWPPTIAQAREIARIVDEAQYTSLQRAAPTFGRA